MPLTVIQSFIIFAIISLTTIFIRVLPFLLFPEHKKTPKYVAYLGNVLPYTIIGMLVVYCLKDISFSSFPFGLPEIISVLTIAVLHIWKGNTLLSIATGTILYMLLVQFVF